MVEKRFPPSIVNDASKRNGKVARASAMGMGRGARKSRPMAYAQKGMSTEPRMVASFIATAKPMR